MVQIGSTPATLDTPIEHLVACHRRIEQRLDTLVLAADHLAKDRPAALAAISASIHFLDTNGVWHTEDEEASLFPRLRAKLAAGEELAFIDSLESQHLEAEKICGELKTLFSSLDAAEGTAVAEYKACAERLRTLYRAHIRSEDEILTALAKRSLDAKELAGISREMHDRRQRRA